MAEYRLISLPNFVQHVLPGEPVVTIPFAPGNSDYEKYLVWLAEGGVPDPYVGANADAIATVEQSYRAGLVREADQLQAQGKDYEAIKLLFKATK